MLSGKTVHATKAKKLGLVDEAVPPRIMGNTVAGVRAAKPATRTLACVPNVMANGFLGGFVASQARKQVAKRARREHYPAPYAIIDLWQKYNGDAVSYTHIDGYKRQDTHCVSGPQQRRIQHLR